MKKNKMMRVASALLVAVLLTTCAISGTFAKYVTSDTDTDTARIAKWGVTVDVAVDGTVDGTVKGAFEAEYDADVSVNDANDTAIAKTVIAVDGVNVLAPGTSGTLLRSAAITGAPEVAVNVTKVATLELTGWSTDGSDYYCPLTITVDNTPFYGLNYNSADEFIAAVEGAIESNINYVPNTDLAEEHEITWAWAFEGTDDKQTNEKDTALGDIAADDQADDITISFTFEIIVTQLD